MSFSAKFKIPDSKCEYRGIAFNLQIYVFVLFIA